MPSFSSVDQVSDLHLQKPWIEEIHHSYEHLLCKHENLVSEPQHLI